MAFAFLCGKFLPSNVQEVQIERATPTGAIKTTAKWRTSPFVCIFRRVPQFFAHEFVSDLCGCALPDAARSTRRMVSFQCYMVSHGKRNTLPLGPCVRTGASHQKVNVSRPTSEPHPPSPQRKCTPKSQDSGPTCVLCR